jgi:DNA invertase Pin-like site-specific DNA recombinase
MKRTKKAVGYVCDIPIPGTDQVIGKEDQRLRIMKYAQKENLQLVCIYEDDKFTENFNERPGVKKVREHAEPFDLLVVERVWSLSRKRKDLEPFMRELDKKGVEMVASSYLWDCISQQVRHRYAGGNMAAKIREEARAIMEAKARENAA